MDPTPVGPDAFLLDLDGVLFHGERALPGARDLLEAIAPLPHGFLTNNPIRTPGEVAQRFVRLGLPAPDPARIISSAQATAQWLAARRPGFRYFAVGAGGLHRALEEVGTPDPRMAEFVVVGEGPGLDFDTLATGVNLILQGGATLVVTNPDLSVDDTRDGRHWVLPGGGALVAPFAAATGRTPVVVGKPEPLLFQMALERLGVAADRCLMVGDRPDTDIAGAAALGMKTALVRTGRFPPGAPWPPGLPLPDWDAPGLAPLLARLRADGILPEGGGPLQGS